MRTFESLHLNELMACADVVLVNHKTFGEKREFPPFPLSITSRGLIYSYEAVRPKLFDLKKSGSYHSSSSSRVGAP